MNLIAGFREGADAYLARTAIVGGNGERATFGDLIRLSAGLAGAWRRRGIGSGDRVLLALPLGIGLYASLAALWRIGATVVLPEPALGLYGVRHAVAATRPKALLASGAFRGLRYLIPGLWGATSLSPDDHETAGWDNVAPLDDDAPALISFTSGSTGRPKAMQRTHGFLRNQNACVREILRPADDRQIDLVAFPVFVLANLELGTTSVLPGWRRRKTGAERAEVLRSVTGSGATRALVPPAICEDLIAARNTQLQTIFTGGGPVFPDLLERLAAAHPNADIVAVYGSTEAEPIAHWHSREAGTQDWSAMRNGGGLLAGLPIPEIRLRIISDEIVVTGEHVSKGYLDSADNSTTKVTLDGETWHRTGDAGRIDSTGRLWLLGRRDGQAKGLFPFCVEAAARYWPDVTGAALISVGDRALLAIAGDPRSITDWSRRARQIGEIDVVGVPFIPLDRRHRSKVDYRLLRKMTSAASRRDN